MATKKQKREAAEAKRKAFLEQERLDGLKALQDHREAAKRREEAMRVKSNEIAAHYREIIESGIADLGEDNALVIAYRKEIKALEEGTSDTFETKRLNNPIQGMTVGEFRLLMDERMGGGTIFGANPIMEVRPMSPNNSRLVSKAVKMRSPAEIMRDMHAAAEKKKLLERKGFVPSQFILDEASVQPKPNPYAEFVFEADGLQIENKTVPFKDKPGGKTIGQATLKVEGDNITASIKLEVNHASGWGDRYLDMLGVAEPGAPLANHLLSELQVDEEARCTNQHCTYQEPHRHGFACNSGCWCLDRSKRNKG